MLRCGSRRRPFQGKILDSLTGLGRFLFRGAFRRGRKIGLSFRFQEINEAVAHESDEQAWEFCFHQITSEFCSCFIKLRPQRQTALSIVNQDICLLYPYSSGACSVIVLDEPWGFWFFDLSLKVLREGHFL